MKNTLLLLPVLISICLISGCRDKNPPVITETDKVNEWVYKVMKENYLWASELPTLKESDYENTPTQKFFDEILRYRYNRGIPLREDFRGDRFSSIAHNGKDEPDGQRTRASTDKEYSYGFNVMHTGSYLPDGSFKTSFVQVIYVHKNTPADGVLFRGDAFDKINGTVITSENFNSLLGQERIEITLLNRETEITEGEDAGTMVPVTVVLEGKKWYYDYPILIDTIYNGPLVTEKYPELEKTAYLMYNHFTDGDSQAKYSDKLKEAFGRYKNAGVENLILDLRYNGGGEVSNAKLLASLIAPPSWLGEIFIYYEYKSSYGKKDDFKGDRLLKASEIGKYNADIQNLYVLTSHNTASASELIIHTLKPIFEQEGRTLKVIGRTTMGKNLGSRSEPFTSKQFNWEISPIIMRVYDKDRESGYESGIAPDTPRNESERDPDYPRYYLMPELGDLDNEWLLNCAVSGFSSVPLRVVPISYGGARSAEQVIDYRIPDRGIIMNEENRGE